MNKKVAYTIKITLQTDGDFSFRKELYHESSPEWSDFIDYSKNFFLITVYDDDKTVWKNGGWADYICRSRIDEFIAAINVSSTHLYIWKDLLEISEELTDWIYKHKEEKRYTAFMSGNYYGTEFSITRG